jgi:hypothetical protein
MNRTGRALLLSICALILLAGILFHYASDLASSLTGMAQNSSLSTENEQSFSHSIHNGSIAAQKIDLQENQEPRPTVSKNIQIQKTLLPDGIFHPPTGL